MPAGATRSAVSAATLRHPGGLPGWRGLVTGLDRGGLRVQARVRQARRSGHSRGAERVVSRCAEQILELTAADAGIAALDDRVGEALGQVSHQREAAVVGLDA